MGQQESHEVHHWEAQSPVPGEESSHGLVHTVGHLAGNQFYEKKHEGPGCGDQASDAFSQQRGPTAAGELRKN